MPASGRACSSRTHGRLPATAEASCLQLARRSSPFLQRILFYDFKGGISVGTAQKAIQESPFPWLRSIAAFFLLRRYISLQEYFGPTFRWKYVAERSTDDFLDAGWPDLHIAAARRSTQVHRSGAPRLDALLSRQGLHVVRIASGRLAWWPTAAQATLKRLSFSWADGPPARGRLSAAPQSAASTGTTE